MPSFSDDFSGTNGALIRQRAGWGYSGSATYQDRGTISSNRAKLGGTSGLTLHYGYVRDTGEAAHWVEAKVLRNSGLCPGLYARWVDSNNFIQVRGNGTTVELIKRVGGTITAVASLTSSLAANDTIRLSVSGSTVKLWRNGAVLGAAGGYTVADAALASATLAGFGGEGSTASAETFDDIAGGGLTAALAPADGRSAGRADAGAVALKLKLYPPDGRSPGRADAGGIALKLALHAGDGRSAGRGDLATLALKLHLGPADGRSVGRAGAAQVRVRFGFAARDGRSAGRSDASGIAIRFGLGAADGRSAGRGDAGALTFHARTVLAVADGRLAGRCDAAALGLRIGLAGARARLGTRADGGGIVWRGVLTAADGRSAVRGVAMLRPPYGPPGIGEIWAVPGEGAASVWAERSDLAVAAEPSRLA